ncbi:MAG: hypothetical protein ABIJ26_02670 [Candidatus Margulisiibacteriota bacterium]
MNINAKIKVAVIFENGQTKPRWFVWEGRKYDVQNVCYVWRDKKGDEDLHLFSVTDGTNTYELVFNAAGMTWHLNNVQGDIAC